MLKAVLITGANRGLGLEFARQYAADGWQVLATERRPGAELRALAAAFPGRVRSLLLDVTDGAAISALAAGLRSEAIDVLINNAGYMGRKPFGNELIAEQSFGRVDYDDWERTLRINLLAPMRMAEAFVEHVARSSERKIITLTSLLGSVSMNNLGGMYPYRTSKAAVNALMKSMAIDLGKRGVLACALHPGWVRTDMGGTGADIDAPEAVRGLRAVIAGLDAAKLGKVYAWDGSVVPY